MSGEPPSDERPSDERPSDERPSDERPSDERPSDERPADERPGGAPSEADASRPDDVAVEAGPVDGGDVVPFPDRGQVVHPSRYGVADGPTGDPSPTDDERGDQISWDDFSADEYLKARTSEYDRLAEAVAKAAEEDIEPQPVAAAIPGLDTGLLGFDDVTGETPAAPSAEAPPRPAVSELAVRIVSGALILGLFVAATLAGGWWLIGLIAAVALLAVLEFYATLRSVGYRPVALFGLLGVLGMLVAGRLGGPFGIGGALVATVMTTAVFYALVIRRRPLENLAFTVLGAAWVGIPLAFAMPIVGAEVADRLVIALVLPAAGLDIGSYFVGRRFGRTALAPVLSPRKTVEGLIGGMLTALLLAFAMTRIGWFDPVGDAVLIWFGAIAAVCAPFGDLAESAVKRALGVKDMGALLPGHGGMLDRIDGILFVVVPAYVVARAFGLL